MKKNKILPNENVNTAIRVSTITLIINLILSLLKFVAGYIGKSSAMLSDAVHSASDVLSTIVVMVGIKISEKRPDKEHPYGHERMECVASIILAAALAVTGAGIGYSGINKIYSGQYNTLSVPGRIALTAAVLSIVIKEWMYWFTRGAAKHTNSDALSTCFGHGERNMPRTPQRKPFIPGLWKPYKSKPMWNICWMCCCSGRQRKKRL